MNGNLPVVVRYSEIKGWGGTPNLESSRTIKTPTCKSDENITLHIADRKRNELAARVTNQLRSLMNTVMNLRVP